MTVDEAIPIAENDYLRTYADGFPNIREAHRLGIEALKAWRECRDKGLMPLGWVLPGETREKRHYICPEDCQAFQGEDGCSSDLVDNMAVYEKDGDYPICPMYHKALLEGKA